MLQAGVELLDPFGQCAAHVRHFFHLRIEHRHLLKGGFAVHVVETTEYITTTQNYRGTADVRREFFRPPYPTATGVIVAGLLREGTLIEIKAIAVLP